jgi:hypothetical protein
MKLTGQCHCGQLAYEINQDNLVRSDCDCRDCQRATGALEVPFVSVNPANLLLKKGTGSEFRAAGGEKCDRYGKWMFCAQCGTTILWMSDSGDRYDVLAGTINEVKAVQQMPHRV